MAPGRMLENLSKPPRPLRRHHFQRRAARQLRPHHALASTLRRKSYEDIVIHNDEWYAANNVTLHKGAKVTGIDRDNKTVTSENGITVSYDRLVIATGSLPFIIPSTAINCRAFSPIAISTMSRRCLKSPKARVAPSSSAPAFWVWKQLMG